MINKKCPYCGKDFTVRASDREQQYCSRECGMNARWSLHNAKKEEKKNAVKKGKKNMASLNEITKKAMEEHLTYGQYVAKYGL